MPPHEHLSVGITLYDFEAVGHAIRDQKLMNLCQQLLDQTSWDLSADSDDSPDAVVERLLATA